MIRERRGTKGRSEFFLDHSDVRDASAYESQSSEKRGIKSFLLVVKRVLRRKRFMLAIVLFGLALFIYYLKQNGYLAPESIVVFLQSHPVVAPLVFMLVYAVMVVCLVPTLPLNLGAGLLWGPYWGGILTVIGAGTGSAVAFLASRYLVSDYLNEKFKNSAWSWLRKEVQDKEWKVVAFTRINPIFPFGPSNYFFGLTQIRFTRYLVTTLLSILPLCIIFAGIGSSIGGIVLEGDFYQLVRDMLAISMAVTLLVIFKLVISRITK
jgi:uncharacterized membrane protein YdjX (TVP38/TMEM64 family)